MDNAFNTAIVDWVKGITGLTEVFQAHQSGYNPWPTPYATFKAVANKPHRSPDFEKIESPSDPTQVDTIYVAHTVVNVSLNIYSENGSQMLSDLYNSNNFWQGRQYFNPINAALDGMSNPRDLSALLDTQYKPRYQADLIFNYQTKITDTDYRVEKLTTEGTIDGESTTITGWDYLP